MTPVALPLPFVEVLPVVKRERMLHPADVPKETQPRTHARQRVAWLAVHLQGWPLHAALSVLSDAERSVLSAQPHAVVDDDRRSTVLASNAIAAGFGIRPGHSLNATISLCAETQFLPRTAKAEVTLLQDIANRCSAYTSVVSAQSPNEVLLEVRGSFKLFGGMNALIERVRSDFDSQGLTVQLALSATAQSALWLARGVSQPRIVTPRELVRSLSRLPVSSLQWPPDIELMLVRFGVLCLGDLLRLPRGSLARRIGYERLAELDHALGRHPQVRKAHCASPRYEDRVLLDFEIETTGLLAQVIERRLQRVKNFLTSRNLAAQELLIDLSHRDADSTLVRIGLASPTADVDHVCKLMHEHLARLSLRAPIAGLKIRIERLCPAPSTSRQLFASIAGMQTAHAVTERQARLLEQLRSRLGERAIRYLAPAADHRPEAAQHQVLAAIQAPSPSVISQDLPPRPLWILPQPLAICSTRTQAQQLRVVRGPERIASGWWDGCAIDRDYFQVRSPRGALAWVFEDRTRPGQWSLHGLFA